MLQIEGKKISIQAERPLMTAQEILSTRTFIGFQLKLDFEGSKVQNVRLIPIVNIIMQNCTKITVYVKKGFFQGIEIKHVVSNSFVESF